MAEIVNLGSAQSPNFRVTGLINDQNQLELPGGKFAQRDIAKLRAYFERLKTQGVDGVTGQRGPFGLTKDQLGVVLTALKTPIADPTGDQPAMEVVRRIGDRLSLPVKMEESVTQYLTASDPSPVEAKSLSAGTALAAVLNAYGLGMTPRIDDKGKLELTIAAVDGSQEVWPVGTPLEGPVGDAIPALVEQLDVEIKDYPLGDVIAAIKARIPAPFLYDYQNLGAQKIDPDKVVVQYPARKAAYSSVLQGVLTRAMLKYQVRQDEAGSAFIWITTIK